MSQFTDWALKMKAVRFFETSGSNYPVTCYSNPADFVPPYENRFATSNVFELRVVYTG